MHPEPRLPPGGRENHQKRILGGFWGEKGPKIGSQSGRLGQKNFLLNAPKKFFQKFFFIFSFSIGFIIKKWSGDSMEKFAVIVALRLP